MLVYVAVDVAINFFFLVLAVSYVIVFRLSLNVKNYFDTISKG